MNTRTTGRGGKGIVGDVGQQPHGKLVALIPAEDSDQDHAG